MKHVCVLSAVLALSIWSASGLAKDIVHDAEYYVLEAQNGERWVSDDREIAQILESTRSQNGGNPPNIVYILLDDVGFG